jgi:hypothetical protein
VPATWSDLIAMLEAGHLYRQFSAGPDHDGLQRQLLSNAHSTVASWLHEQSSRLADAHVLSRESPALRHSLATDAAGT